MELNKPIMFMGIAGSGKTTQSKLLENLTGVKRFGAGELMKQDPHMLKELEAGNEINRDKAYKWTYEILKEHRGESIVLDGFFRSNGNFIAIQELFPKLEIVFLQTSIKQGLDRILSRGRDKTESNIKDTNVGAISSIVKRMIFDGEKINNIFDYSHRKIHFMPNEGVLPYYDNSSIGVQKRILRVLQEERTLTSK